jgi:hypothetical protein
MLHVSERSVRLAKHELRRVGFLTWRSHGGLPLTADYRFQFGPLLAACDRIEKQAKELLPRRTRAPYRKISSGMPEDDQTGNSLQQTGSFLPETPEEDFRQTYPLNLPNELVQRVVKEEADTGEEVVAPSRSEERGRSAPPGSAVASPRGQDAPKPDVSRLLKTNYIERLAAASVQKIDGGE